MSASAAIHLPRWFALVDWFDWSLQRGFLEQLLVKGRACFK